MWRAIVDYEYNYEHPPLAKLAYGLAILPLPPAPLLPDTRLRHPIGPSLDR